MPRRYQEAFFSKEVVQRLQLLKLLYNSENAVGIKDIVFKMELDRRSVYKLIEALNVLIKSEKLVSEIEAISRGQYIFNGDKLDYFKLRAKIVNNEPMMNLAKEFLTKDTIDFSNFSTDNFISESTLRKYLRNANSLLNPLGITINIQRNQIRINGNEVGIRYCLVSFFWRYYQGIFWPFKNVDRRKIDHFTSSLFSVFEEISYGKKLQLTYYWAVFIQRSMAGNEILKSELPNYFDELLFNNKTFKKFFDKFEVQYKLSTIEIKLCFFILYIFPESYKYIQNTSETLEILKMNSSDSYNSIRDFIIFVRKKHPNFEVISEKRTRFLAMLISGRIFVDTFKDIYFNSSSITIFTYTAKNYPNFLPSIRKNIEKSSPDISINMTKSLTLRYAQAYAAEFSPRDFEVKLIILLDSDLPLYVDIIMRKKLDYILSPRFNYEWVSLKQKIRPDILLATGPTDLRFSNVPKVLINAEVTEKDSSNIIKMCKQLILQRKEDL